MQTQALPEKYIGTVNYHKYSKELNFGGGGGGGGGEEIFREIPEESFPPAIESPIYIYIGSYESVGFVLAVQILDFLVYRFEYLDIVMCPIGNVYISI